jgi:hypothetical protein
MRNDQVTVAVVLGMHKSGTSLVSEILHHSGIEMVEHDPALGYEDKFHHERIVTAELNKDLLKAHGEYSLDTIRRIDAGQADPELKRAAARFVSEMSEREVDWGFKDPRTCLTYDLWRCVLPSHKLICIFRDVPEVLQHYARLNLRPATAVLSAWYHYNRAMLDAFERAPGSDRLMLHYRTFMHGDEGLAALSGLLNRPVVDRRTGRLMRSKGGSRPSFRLKAFLHRLRTSQDIVGLNRRLRQTADVQGRRNI